MTFENHTKQQYRQKVNADAIKPSPHEQDPTRDQEAVKGKKTKIGLNGGQPADNPDGLDISQYTGPGSKPSSEFNAPEEYHSGPGNGLSDQKKADEADWENPEPGNDSF